MRVAQVILDIQTKALDTAYTYLVPETQEAGDFPIEVGCAVQVPFGNRPAIGFVTSISEVGKDFSADDTLLVERPETQQVALRKMKPITRAISHPYFTAIGAKCAFFLAHRYVAPLAVCIRLFTPTGAIPKMTKERGFWEIKAPAVGEVDDRWVVPGSAFAGFTPKDTAVKQKAVLAALSQGEVRVAELNAEYGSVASVLKSLSSKDVVVVEHRRRLRGVSSHEADSAGQTAFTPSPRPRLNEAQAHAVDAIRAMNQAGGGVVLVDGITGSGKTEVYLHAIEEVLAQGRTALVLVPEIALTPQTVARFRGRFGRVVAVLHSNMAAGERFDQWDFIRSGQARVVVGARSALFAPLENLGLIVIDEEHESSYKQDSAPRYVSRDVARWLAGQHGCALVLGSATPSLEALHQAENNPRWTHVLLAERANGKPLPPVTVVDRSVEGNGGEQSAVFSPALKDALSEELSLGRKCVLLLNQRGFARFLICRDCGFIPGCVRCATSLTFHQRTGRGPHLACHHCGTVLAVPPRCPECGSVNLRMLGAGTERVEEELASFLADLPEPARSARIVRMDADTTRTKGAHQRLLEEFSAPGAAVLLGTQMIAKGLDFEDVTLVGVISADTMLGIPDFRSTERTFDLIEQVAGRAGRAALPGRVIVQTYRSQEPAIRAAAAYDRALFLSDELPKRRMLGYPPYVRLTNVLVWGKNEEAVATEARALEASLRETLAVLGPEGAPNLDGGRWTVFPATSCPFAKREDRYRWHVVVKSVPGTDVSAPLGTLIRAHRAPEGISISVDVDASDLL